jgi:7-cyano-7-deazaguanine synthase
MASQGAPAPTVSSKPKAVALLSGGLDSTTCIAVANDQGFDIHALTVDYGQKNRFELEAAKRIGRHYGVVEHKLITIDLRTFGGSSLTTNESVERNRPREIIGTHIPTSYVPARNTILLSYALAWAEVLETENIFIGVNAVDAGGYPDCRPEFISAFEGLANCASRLGTELGKRVKVNTPLIHLSKAEIIRLGTSLGVDYSMTCTCYDPAADGQPCGTCDSCILRQNGFFEADLIDPLPYVAPLSPPKHLTHS